jgi:hypothetical protein
VTTRRSSRNTERGSSLVEFTLVGIGLIFVLISTFEMARGMWVYHTLSHISKEATRFLIVHGKECQDRAPCLAEATLGTFASRVQYHGVGLLPSELQIQVYRNGSQVVGSGGGFVTLASLLNSATVWDTDSPPGLSIQVNVRYPFRSGLAMFWPGGTPVNFSLVTFGATSWDNIQF